MLAAVLGAALAGIDDAQEPCEPITGNAYDALAPALPARWDQAISRFHSDPAIARIFHGDLIANLVAMKRQEMGRFVNLNDDNARAALEIETYLDQV